ncbi:MAG: hypothetical protein HKN92_12030 [Chitinophagales bacterium]|nr:hypothetical protein [Chitinophagales bacterium]
MLILIRSISTIFLLFICSALYAQPCITAANPFTPGYCNNDSIPCDGKNFNTKADFITDLFDYKLVNVSEYASLQAFGRIGNSADDNEVLSCRLYLPENAHILRPVIMFSSLSSFTSSRIIGSLQNYFCSYFAKKGFVVVSYESRKFFIDRSQISDSSVLTDFITNPYYTGDSAVLADFINFRDNNLTQDYKFADLLVSLSKGANGSQLVHDAYLEMIYKITYDSKHLLELLSQNQNALNINAKSAFLVGGSAAAVQSLHAGLLEHPDQLDSILDTVAMAYRGLSFPAPGNLSDDFTFEPALSLNIRPLGVVNFWGFLTSLDIMDPNDPSVFNAHGSWDHIFSYQQTYQEQMQHWFGFGAEALFVEAKNKGIHSDLYTVCHGKHALYPVITDCKFKRIHTGQLFKDLLLKVNSYFLEHGLILKRDDIYAFNLPLHYRTTPPPVTLQPSPTNLLSDSNDHCPIVYPDHFNLSYYDGNLNTSTGQLLKSDLMKVDLEHVEVSKSEVSGSIDASVFPNPFSEDLVLDILLADHAILDVKIYDQKGALIHQPYISYSICKGLHKLDLNIEGVVPGTYHIDVFVNGELYYNGKSLKF